MWLDFNPQKGHEQAGRRPALVISPAVYNGISNCAIVCPITSNRSPWPWKVMLPEGGEITGAILVDQIKSIDGEARRLSASGHRADDSTLGEVLARLATLTA
ncbi:MAG: type II toxin-antitoxin system PemK/MazF family toxin [Thalassobaculum sp.]|uniref:type II toxin-antitoxin system PemK/MazF family toxin n=1 Tax=Thalassobaculum sp. TaxID=2022740 RepID=UPI0032EC975D